MPFLRVTNLTAKPVVIQAPQVRFSASVPPNDKYENVLPQDIFDALQPALQRLKAVRAILWDATFYDADIIHEGNISGIGGSLGLTALLVFFDTIATPQRHHRCDPSGGSFTLMFPAARSMIDAFISTKNIAYGSPNIVTFASTGGESFDGGTSWELSEGEGRIWIATTAGWESLS